MRNGELLPRKSVTTKQCKIRMPKNGSEDQVGKMDHDYPEILTLGKIGQI